MVTTIQNGAEKAETGTRVSSLQPSPYTGFDGQYIGGLWRPGKQGLKAVDTDPYSGEPLTESRKQTSKISTKLTNLQRKRKCIGRDCFPRSEPR